MPFASVLAVDASTRQPTVAVLVGGHVVAEAVIAGAPEGHRRADEPLMPTVLKTLASAGVRLGQLEAIVCGAGPGSFTSLRTAAAIAKGLATALGIPLLAVPSLALIVAGAEGKNRACYLAMIDAGRGERFVAPVQVEADRVAQVGPTALVPAAAVAGLASEHGAVVVGPETGEWPHARGVARMAWGEPVDLASWEPDYGRQSAAEDRRR